jgi:hypothetical protein
MRFCDLCVFFVIFVVILTAEHLQIGVTRRFEPTR